MCAKGLLVLLLLIVTTDKFFVSGRLHGEGLIGGSDIDSKEIVLKAPKLFAVQKGQQLIRDFNKCGGNHTTSRKTVEITKDYLTTGGGGKDQRCVWHFRVRYPEYRIGACYLSYLSSGVDSDTYEDYYNAPEVAIYDGPDVDESKKLFRLGDKSLVGKFSTGPDLTIVIDYKVSDVFEHQQIKMKVCPFRVHTNS